MKTASSPMQSHIQQQTTSLCTLWKITRTDGRVLAFTDHDRDIAYGDDVAVPILNAGFETDILDADAFTNNSFAVGWTGPLAGTGAYGAQHIVVSDGGEAAPEGSNVMYLAGDGVTDIYVRQVLGENWLPSTAYTLTFQQTVQSFATGKVVARLKAGSVVLATATFTEATPGSYLQTLSYTTPAVGSPIGQPITIEFFDTAADLLTDTGLVDDVRLSHIATYLAATGFVRTAVAGAGDLSAQNSEVDVILDSSAITDTDIRKGLYDYATVEVRAVNWEDLTMGEIKLLTGKLGQVELRNVMAKAELRSLLQLLTPKILKQYSPTCRAVLGDSKCTINLDQWKVLVTVSGKTDDRTFVVGAVRPDTWARDGKIVWLTGNNAGLTMEVKSQDAAGNIVLYLPMGFPITVGDKAYLFPGCDRALLGAVDIQGQQFATTVTKLYGGADPASPDYVVGAQSFRVSPVPAADFADNGKVVWRSGGNVNVITYCGTQNALGDITLYEAMPNEVHKNDTLYLYPSAVGITGDCKGKFNNVVNMRGEPWVPGLDSILMYPNLGGGGTT